MKSKRHIYVIPAALLIAVMLTGCSVTGVTFEDVTPAATATPTPLPYADWGDTVIAKIGETELDSREVMLYLLAAKEEAEILYGPDIWNYVLDTEGTTYADKQKEAVLEELISLKIISSKVDELNIDVNTDDDRFAVDCTADFINRVGRVNLNLYNITDDIIKQMYVDNLTATKVYENITLWVDTNVSDEEARQVSVQYIYLKNYTISEDGSHTEYSETNKQDTYEKALTLLETGKTKSNFADYAKLNTESATGVEMTVGRGELSEELEDVVFALDSKRFSDVITAEDGYYIFYCVNRCDEDATALRKEEIIVERQQKLFNETYEKWKSETEIIINEPLWKDLKI